MNCLSKDFGQCRVYDNGDIDIRHPNGFVYEIDGKTLSDTDWVGHIKEKRWVNQTDFLCAYVYALITKIYGRRNETDKIPKVLSGT